VLRQIPNRLLTFEQIGLPEVCRDLIRRPRGMFLVTGPTGSGKTTSLATMIDYINTTMDRHIVTMEDPIEYYHYHKKSIVNQREVGNDVPSFAEALRRVLRQDPDVILVGEMRDLETIESAVRAAETGHLVFGTLHTTGAAKTIDRIVDAFPVTQQNQIRVQLSTALLCVLSQVLLTRAIAGHGRWVRVPGGHARHRQPDPRSQDLPHRFGDPDRQEVRHAVAGRPPLVAVHEGDDLTRRR
jgi:twitching motility protein PilT